MERASGVDRRRESSQDETAASADIQALNEREVQDLLDSGAYSLLDISDEHEPDAGRFDTGRWIMEVEKKLQDGDPDASALHVATTGVRIYPYATRQLGWLQRILRWMGYYGRR